MEKNGQNQEKQSIDVSVNCDVIEPVELISCIINQVIEETLSRDADRAASSTQTEDQRLFVSTPILRINDAEMLPYRTQPYSATDFGDLHKLKMNESLAKLLPTYSTVMKLGPPPGGAAASDLPRTDSFIPRQPPPSYAEVEGVWSTSASLISSDTMIFGPEPLYIICPRCMGIVVTRTRMERSNMAHFTALILCLCFCWPCCFVPYCSNSCNNVHHSCPNCDYYFGMYTPW